MDLTIVNPYFAANNSGNAPAGTLYLYLNGFDEKEEPVEMYLSLGADWVTADGGKTITHPTKTRINKSSTYGHWLTHAAEIPELASLLYHRGPPTQADVWTNLVLHLELREIKFGRNIDPSERLMPVAFLGEYSDSPLTTPATSPTLKPSPADIVAQAKAKAASANGGSPLYDEMISLAKASSNFPAFLAAALANPDVLADDELAQQVADEGGIWAAANS
jgi:hypothetical protein